MTGVYDANTNTFNVTNSQKEELEYQAVEVARNLGINLMPVAVDGLIATPPRELASRLSAFLDIPNLPKDAPVFPYVVYTLNGFYLALSDTNVLLPAKVTLQYQGQDLSFTFSAGNIRGTLVKLPMDKINFGEKWKPDEFDGVIIADSLSAMEPISATVKDVNADPANYAFKRVSIDGSYLVTTATVDYSDMKAQMGQGLLASNYSDLFSEDNKLRLETIDPGQGVWQLRQTTVTGTVLYPTAQMLKYLDWSAPVSKDEIVRKLKPALIVDTLKDDVVNAASISDINPFVGDPSKYWGKVVEFEGYALGEKYPLKNVAEAITKTEIPVNVNLLAVGIADKIVVGSQLAIIGLDNDLLRENGELIKGKFKFRVAVSKMPNQLEGVPNSDSAFFLLSKEELPMTLPITVPPSAPTLPTPIPMPTKVTYTLTVFINPLGAGSVLFPPSGGSYLQGTLVTLTAVPSFGYTFDRWGGSISGTSSITTVTMDSNLSVIAYFKSRLP